MGWLEAGVLQFGVAILVLVHTLVVTVGRRGVSGGVGVLVVTVECREAVLVVG